MTPVAAMRLRANNVALAARVAAILAGFSGPKAWFDLPDVSSLQQDIAGTVPVASAGDPIGRAMDKSGAGNHATQVTTTSRPLWQTTYAAFDGLNKSWLTPSIDFTSTNRFTVIAGIRKLSDAALGMVAEFGPISTSNGTFYLAAPLNAGVSNVAAGSRGTSATFVAATGIVAPTNLVLTASSNIASPILNLRVNGSAVASTASQGSGNYGNYPLYIGRRNNATLPFNGNLYGLIVIGRQLTAEEMWYCERYMAQQVGIVLP